MTDRDGTRLHRARGASLAIVLAGLLAGCGDKDEVASTPPPPKLALSADVVDDPAPQEPAKPETESDRRLARVVDLLNASDEAGAKAELKQLLQDDPGRREAETIRQSIEGDPREMVPSDSFSYVVKPGDTYVTLARDYLDDPYKFYALARLNGIRADTLKPGDTLQIPGRYRDPTPVRPVERPRPARSRPTPAAAEQPTQAPPPPRAARHTDPARAQQLRRAGLERMSAGQIDPAVRRLEQASRLDPANAAIGEDLARARRIQATMRTRK